MKGFTIILLLTTLVNLSKLNAQEFGILIDNRDNKTYKTVKIGDQNWMAENLAYKADSLSWVVYDNDTSNVSKYGYLYTWKIAKNVCPDGWHLPSKNEFEILLSSISDDDNFNSKFEALRPDGNSGFHAVLGGMCYLSGLCTSKDQHAFFWSASTNTYKRNGNEAWDLYFTNAEKWALMGSAGKSKAYSVRCVMDN